MRNMGIILAAGLGKRFGSTIHLSWGARDGFLTLEKLLAKLEGKVASWSELK